jgi:hypothetical protein
MVWFSLGEETSTMDSINSSLPATMGTAIPLMWMVFTNVLLLNLLISMMAETFKSDQKVSHITVSIICVCLELQVLCGPILAHEVNK